MGKRRSSNLVNVSERLLVCFLVSLFVIAIFLIAGLFYWNLLEKKSFGIEIGKSLLQVIVVSVIGTTASLLLADFNRARETVQKEIENQRRVDENTDQFRKEILRRENKIYRDTKRARRLLRARGFSTPFAGVWNKDAPILLDVYDKYMEFINDSQLELEILESEIKNNEKVFSNSSKLTNYIKEMEEYLGQIVTEFEQKRANFSGTPASLAIKKLEKMKDLLGPYSGDARKNANSNLKSTDSNSWTDKDSCFKTKFVQNHKNLIESIRRDLLTKNQQPTENRLANHWNRNRPARTASLI